MTEYDDFAETFGASREDMRWVEICRLLDNFVEYFDHIDTWKIADIWCGNGRLLRHILEETTYLLQFQSHHTHYFWADLSQKLLMQAEESPELGQVADMIEWKCMNMRDLWKIFATPLFHAFFFIASFHHLETYEERLTVLKETKKILLPGGKIYMTNWHLLSQKNEKYSSSKTVDYQDGSADFIIKIGKYDRFYHSFSLEEYQKLAQETELDLQLCEFGEKNSSIILAHLY